MPTRVVCPECGDRWLGDDFRAPYEEVVCNDCYGGNDGDTDPEPVTDGGQREAVEERFYDRLDGGDVSGHPGTKPLSITCPGCGYATEVDFEVWDCEHCGTRLALFVGSFAAAQSPNTESDCADANHNPATDGGLPDHIEEVSTLTNESVYRCITCGCEVKTFGSAQHYPECPERDGNEPVTDGGMPKVGVRLPQDHLDELDNMDEFATRSEAIRAAVRKLLADHRPDSRRRGILTGGDD